MAIDEAFYYCFDSLVLLEALREFQFITNTFAAEYGRNAGSYVNQITRSGTNEFHGTGFYNWDGNGVDALTTNQQRCVNHIKGAERHPHPSHERIERKLSMLAGSLHFK
ncbi:MAG: hypothetical protein H0U54_09435 [Acidobacteria bacterium]|nr:hypothetical protein [Acidobacteriota bacterium]